MASLAQVPKVLRAGGPIAFGLRVWQQMNEDNIFVWASALAYSWLFAIFPFLVVLLTFVPYLPNRAKSQAASAISQAVHTSLPEKAAATILENVDAVMHQPRHGLAITGLAITLWAASGGMATTMSALDRCYDVKRSRPYIQQRVIAMVLTVLFTSVFLVVMILLPVGGVIQEWLRHKNFLPLPVAILFSIVRYVLSVFLLMIVLAMAYYFGPNIKQKFEPLSPGAMFTIFVWILLGLSFRFYIDRFAQYNKTYGAVGGVAVLLLFFYLDALVLLVGAEINSEVDFTILGIPSGDAVPQLPQGKLDLLELRRNQTEAESREE